MCIVVLTTAHPKYPLIVIDNRDEFLLRPTSRPHWWSTPASRHPSRTATPDVTSRANGHATPSGHPDEVQHILSARDLQRAEKGTWLGITRSGHFAVLTNYRELDPDRLCQPVSGDKSRGAMVTSWLGNSTEDSVRGFVEAMMADGGCQGYGGFSLLCGKLRKRPGRDGEGDGLEPLAILSNRAEHPDQIPWIAGKRGETVGLSNAAFDDPEEWPKVKSGKALLEQVVAEAIKKDLSEEELQERLFWILDHDTLPTSPEKGLEEHLELLKESIFIPAIGDSKHREDMARAAANGNAGVQTNGQPPDATVVKVTGTERPDPQTQGFATGMYGTQRQTIILVDWDGNVTYTERALWDANGNALERGKGDLTFRFSIEGWDEAR